MPLPRPLRLAAGAALSLLSACTSNSPPVTVSGMAIGNDLQPVAGAQVQLTSGSFSVTATTDAAGGFSASGVPVPYDAMLVVPALAEVTLYQGLTRPDPTLVSLGSSVATHPAATVSGTISGGSALPLPANARTRVTFGSAEGGGVANADGATGAYQVGPSWWGSSSTTGTLYALQWQYDAAGLPLSYTGFASRTGVTLADGANLTGQDLTLAPVSSGQLSGSVTPPSGYTPNNRRFLLVFGADQGALELVREIGAANDFGFLAPAPAGASLLLVARASAGSALSTGYQPLPTQGTGLSATLVPAAELAAPADGAVGVTPGTQFSWSPSPGGVSLLVVRGSSTFVVVTAGASATLPDAASLGFALPAGSVFSWYVFGVGPFSGIDAAAGRGGYLGPFIQPAAALFQTQSPARTLTSAP
ncbi:MAG TPA: hypothetical protein VK454_11470 [Myxococcaceae bacterium]|nr:hypothetical protein [Myxococcaceae bacterium]